jgi:diguanylate cyclase (GGDEF)-like protein/PAS domain S-box-containing protein
MIGVGTAWRRSRIRRPALAAPVVGLVSVLVVLAMVAAAVIAQQSSDLHRRAQVVAEQIRSSSQEMSALKWRTNTLVLMGTANLSGSGAIVSDGTRILTQLSAQATQLGKLEPGADAQRLVRDARQLLLASIIAAGASRDPSSSSPSSLTRIQDQFEPILDRMNSDARLAAQHQQVVAAQALGRSMWLSIGSMLLGVGMLGLLGWRLAIGNRRSALAFKERAMERRSEQRVRALVDDASEVVTVLGRDLRVRWQAASIRSLLGAEPDSHLDADITSLAHPEDQPLLDTFLRAAATGNGSGRLLVRLRHTDGRWLNVEIVAKDRFSDPAVRGLVLNMRDVSQRVAMENELRHQAFHDALTGLANRALFEDRLRHALAAGVRSRRPLAVLFIDLDDFKTINDSLGHGAGDALLQSVAARIDPLVRPTDTAARLGGDEFAVLLDGVANAHEARTIARRILAALGERFMLEARELRLTASIGIAVSDDSMQADELLRNADTAMYAAKASGKNAVQAFEPTMHRTAVERFELRTELPAGLEREEFYLDYQPIVSLDTGRIVGVEALVRWQHPVRGRVAPDQFIGLAEETGLIVELGQWVLDQACRQAREWQLAAPHVSPIRVSVNVSIRQLRDDDFPDRVADILRRTALAPHLLILEITEGMLADDPEALVRRLRALRELGVQVAIDDFGTGYSALSHLRQFPFDVLKIDKSFIDQLGGDIQNANLVESIINLGESLEVDVIAEGIEQPQQAEQLRAIRATLGQGYLFSTPTTPSDILALLREPAAQQPGG